MTDTKTENDLNFSLAIVQSQITSIFIERNFNLFFNDLIKLYENCSKEDELKLESIQVEVEAFLHSCSGHEIQ